nr:serine/threonine-protein kinase [Streptomyces specialis]
MRPVGSKYLLEEPLGRGATGTVWRARQREAAGEEAAVAGQPGEQVAIKVLKEELAHDPDVVMRFLRERSVLLRLAGDNHDNIVRTRDLVVEGELIALVMDLIDGPDLHRYLYDNGPLTPVAAALLTAQIADALAAAHAKGVVHRDLKPANVLLAGDGNDAAPLRPMLTDFGIARLADSPGVTRAHEFVGSPSYVAPESAEGRPQTSAVDIYSAGILLYELVTGRPPFSGSSTLQVLQRHISEEPRRPEGMPGPLWTVVECCLRKNPAERPGAAGLARALRTVAAGIGQGTSHEQRQAALGVAALLVPDPAPVRVPGTGISPPGSAEPTQVLPGGSAGGGADPFAATSVLPQHWLLYTSDAAGEGGGGGGVSGPCATAQTRHRARRGSVTVAVNESMLTGGFQWLVEVQLFFFASGSRHTNFLPVPGAGRCVKKTAAAAPARAAPAAAGVRLPAAAAVPAAPAVPPAAAVPAAAAVSAPGAAAVPGAAVAPRPRAARPVAQRQPDAHPRSGVPEGLPVHAADSGGRRLPGVELHAPSGLDRRRP